MHNRLLLVNRNCSLDEASRLRRFLHQVVFSISAMHRHYLRAFALVCLNGCAVHRRSTLPLGPNDTCLVSSISCNSEAGLLQSSHTCATRLSLQKLADLAGIVSNKPLRAELMERDRGLAGQN